MNEELFDFLEKSPTAYQAVDEITKRLEAAGFEKLHPTETWKVVPGGHYFVTQNGTAVIAFTAPEGKLRQFKAAASHSDSPAFKLKANPEMTDKTYVRLNVEKYGGMLIAPWFDRPLSIAGRVIVSEGDRLVSRLVNIEKDLLMIPSLCIHFDRTANEGHEFDIQKELLPIAGEAADTGLLKEIIAENAGVAPDAVIASDLFVVNRDKPTAWGLKNEFIASPRLDDLECTYADLIGYLEADGPADHTMNVYSVFDNEEVGSRSRQGADSTFFRDTLERAAFSLGLSGEEFRAVIFRSFVLSADNAHAVHPAHTDKYDPVNQPEMNGGPVIKYNAAQKYTTDAISAAVFKTLCKKAGVPCQEFTNNSDIAGGSTLGNLLNSTFPAPTVDIGLAQLAMHSPYESAGTKDPEYLIRAVKCFYETELVVEGEEIRLVG
ncbi:MAG: M18 family aminopeptidase [Lachnospiraceae bacterium]|nr:M18 family aminopeptidase [Lachnospiraceae bacterium]